MIKCTSCHNEVDDVRFGVCFDCATAGEERVAKRTVVQHIKKGIHNLKQKNYEYAKYDFSWAWQRLTKTGDYEKDGAFDCEGYD